MFSPKYDYANHQTSLGKENPESIACDDSIKCGN